MQVQDVMTRAVIAFTPETRTEDAARLLVRGRITGAPVIGADGTPVGIVSLVDLVDPDRTCPRVGDLVHRRLVTIAATDEIETAAARMLDEDIRRLVVLDTHRRLIGIVTASDVLRGMVRELG
jgi:CBS domain-containing membrane protein